MIAKNEKEQCFLEELKDVFKRHKVKIVKEFYEPKDKRGYTYYTFVYNEPEDMTIFIELEDLMDEINKLF